MSVSLAFPDHPHAVSPLPRHGEAASIRASRVQRLPIEWIDATQTAYSHRVHVEVAGLAEQMNSCGLNEPIIVEPCGAGEQVRIISGWRRYAAAVHLGWAHIPAIVRRDLDGRRALIASVVGNEGRAPYNDIERALIIKRWDDAGIKDVPVTEVLGIGDKQRRNLLSLLQLPAAARAAIIDGRHGFTGTHALHLLRARSADADFDIVAWVGRIDRENLSVAALKRCLARRNQRHLPPSADHRLFDPSSNFDEGVIVFRRQVIKVGSLEPDIRDRLRRQALQLVELLEALD